MHAHIHTLLNLVPTYEEVFVFLSLVLLNINISCSTHFSATVIVSFHLDIFKMYVYELMYLCTMSSVRRDQKKALDTLELELGVVESDLSSGPLREH